MTLKDPAYNTGKFGEVKELVLGMLDTYNYEKVYKTLYQLYHSAMLKFCRRYSVHSYLVNSCFIVLKSCH